METSSKVCRTNYDYAMAAINMQDSMNGGRRYRQYSILNHVNWINWIKYKYYYYIIMTYCVVGRYECMREWIRKNSSVASFENICTINKRKCQIWPVWRNSQRYESHFLCACNINITFLCILPRQFLTQKFGLDEELEAFTGEPRSQN